MPPPTLLLLWLLAGAAGGTSAQASASPGTPANNSTESCTVGSDGEQDNVAPGLVWMGTIMTAVASVLNCLAVLLQKRAHMKNEELPPKPKDPTDEVEGQEYRAESLLCNLRWVVGILCMILGASMDMAALPFVPMSRVAALGSISIIVNIFMAPCILGDQITWYDVIGSAITTAGTVVAVYFGSGDQAKMTNYCLLMYFADAKFLGYAAIIVVVLILCIWLVTGFRNVQDWAQSKDIGSKWELPVQSSPVNNILSFESAVAGTRVAMTPSGLTLPSGERCRFSGTVVGRAEGSVTIRWDDPDAGGPPRSLGIPQERAEAREWWDSGARPTPADPVSYGFIGGEQRDATILFERAITPRVTGVEMRGRTVVYVAGEDDSGEPTMGGEAGMTAGTQIKRVRPAGAGEDAWKDVPDHTSTAIKMIRAAWDTGDGTAELAVSLRDSPEFLDCVWLHEHLHAGPRGSPGFLDRRDGEHGWQQVLCGGWIPFVYSEAAAPRPRSKEPAESDAEEREVKNHWDRILQVVKGQQFYPVLHAFYAGIIGAQSVMFAKAALLFFSNACKGVEVGKSAGLFVAFLFPMGICLWNQIYYLNMALRIYPDAVFVLPVYQVSWIAGGACSGLVFYQEYVLMSWTQLSLFWMGIIVSGVGLIILANREHMERRGCVVGADDPPAPSAGESLLSPFSPPPEDRRASQASRRDSRPAALRRLSRERAASTSTNGLSNGPTSSSVTAGDPAAHDTEPPSRKPSADSAAPYGAVQRDRASRMSANLDAVEGVMALRGDPVFSEHSPTGADWAGAPGMAFEHEHSPSAITWTTNAVE